MEDRTGVDTGRRSKVKEEPGKKPVMTNSILVSFQVCN